MPETSKTPKRGRFTKKKSRQVKGASPAPAESLTRKPDLDIAGDVEDSSYNPVPSRRRYAIQAVFARRGRKAPLPFDLGED